MESALGTGVASAGSCPFRWTSKAGAVKTSEGLIPRLECGAVLEGCLHRKRTTITVPMHDSSRLLRPCEVLCTLLGLRQRSVPACAAHRHTDPISGLPLAATTIHALSPKAIPAQRLRCGYRAVSRGAAGCPCARQQRKAGSVTVYLGQKPSPVRWPCVPAGAGGEPLFTLIPPYEKYLPADCRYWRRPGWPVVCTSTAGARRASHCVRQKPWPWRAHEHAPR